MSRKLSRLLKLALRVLPLIIVLSTMAQAVAVRTDERGYRIVDIKTDSLPGLNISRTAHATLCLDGEITVFGGHTKGFVPTATAEYFRDGKWHTVPLTYPHDNGTALPLRSGKVFLAGGFKENLGIGQLFSAELYDPATHISTGFGCMSRKRAMANAIEMADNRVVVAGNWYAEDGIGMFENVEDPVLTNAINVKDVSIGRANPYVLKISDDDAIIFSSLGNKSESVNGSIIDRLKGPAYRETLLDTWRPLPLIEVSRSYNLFIGDEKEGRYEWLLPVLNDSIGQVAIAKVEGPKNGESKPKFSLLPTFQSLPDSIGDSQIVYSSLVCDRVRGLAYLIGSADKSRILVVAIDYKNPEISPFILYVTDNQPIIAGSSTPVLTSEGDLLFAGGHLTNNFSPSNSVIRLPLGGINEAAGATVGVVDNSDSVEPVWWMLVIIPCIILVVVTLILLARRRKSNKEPIIDKRINDELSDKDLLDGELLGDELLDKDVPKDEFLTELMSRIERLMEKERLYLNANLKASDVAAAIGSNRTYVSAAINSQRGCSFSQFLTDYRIAYAKEQMRRNPDAKISIISASSGFSTDSTFFRAFRADTGMTPKEWLARIRGDRESDGVGGEDGMKQV